MSCLPFLLEIQGQKLVGTAVKEAIQGARTIQVLVSRLNQKSTSLSAALALARLVKIGKSSWWAVTGTHLFHCSTRRRGRNGF